MSEDRTATEDVTVRLRLSGERRAVSAALAAAARDGVRILVVDQGAPRGTMRRLVRETAQRARE